MDEIHDYGPLDWSELAIPDQINGDVALQESTVVILENQRLLFNESRELSSTGGRYGNGTAAKKEDGKVVIRSHDEGQKGFKK